MDIEPGFRPNRLPNHPNLSHGRAGKRLEGFQVSMDTDSDLVQRLVELPDIRAERVEEVKKRVNEANYPQDDIVRGLACLFVRKLDLK